MEPTSAKGHSEEFFGDYRDFWWNRDFIELLARRWRLESASELLDVGCGLCHWSLLLAPHLEKPARITAVDRDTKWAAGDPLLARRFDEIDASVSFMPADAYALPFVDDHFDVVTCQTLLIHCSQPESALGEMLRVVKPGGIVICAEPNNLIGAASFDSIEEKASVDHLVDNFRERLLCERGRLAMGAGNISLGDKLAYLFSQNGLDDIQSYISDRVNPLYPPYDRPEQQAEITQARQSRERQQIEELRRQNVKYASALSDAEALSFIDGREQQNESYRDKFNQALNEQTYYSGGLSVMYVVSGRK